jgi:hypothetical protein
MSKPDVKTALICFSDIEVIINYTYKFVPSKQSTGQVWRMYYNVNPSAQIALSSEEGSLANSL